MNNKEVSDVLQNMLELLNTPDSWCQGWSAMNDKGEGVGVTAEDATMHCIAGALTLLTLEDGYLANKVHALLDKTLVELHPKVKGTALDSIIEFNDAPNTKYEDMIAIIQKAKENTDAILHS